MGQGRRVSQFDCVVRAARKAMGGCQESVRAPRDAMGAVPGVVRAGMRGRPGTPAF